MALRSSISIYTDSPDRPFSICNTGFIYENNLDSDPQTDIFCGRSSLNWSYYRVKPEESSCTHLNTFRALEIEIPTNDCSIVLHSRVNTSIHARDPNTNHDLSHISNT
ncbi:hypothetical protein K469DRAFT_714496 [Zopfia rhizophila CBS 207.26]|uniref:Uncharacterized protein n=1 Tax=Zopfia rhizophila CBS 207.26 TaxID=1314779 RepID=A0A6A6DLY7_9PEZI|nr:hypothetical protein K469DRAFT_714496 [Zopfia rhizophila CBS 207.26]